MKLKTKLTLRQKILVLLTLLSVASIAYIVNPPPRKKSPASNTTPSSIPTPSPTTELIELISSNPFPGRHKNFPNRGSIEFSFSQSVKFSSLQFSVNPQIDLQISSTSPNKITLTPKSNWETNQIYLINLISIENPNGKKIPLNFGYDFGTTNY